MQYGHIVFLFVILLMSKYIFVSDRSNGKLSRLLSRIVPYTLPVFMIHFPLLYFFAALTGHDPADPLDQAFLFFAVLVTSLAFGKLCFLTKPAFDRLQNRGAALIEQQVPGVRTERPPAAMSGALPHRR